MGQPPHLSSPAVTSSTTTTNSSTSSSPPPGPEAAALAIPKASTTPKKRALAEVEDEKTPEKKPAAKKAKTTPPPPPPSARPKRERKAPVRFGGEPEKEKKKKKKDVATKKKPAPAPPKTKPKTFDPVFITTSPRSRLVKTDLYHLLLEPGAWDALSAQDQATLVGMLPRSAANQNLLKQVADGAASVARPKALGMCNTFSADVRRFKEALGAGQFTKSWLREAHEAMKGREAGEFDAWKEEEAELWWGQKMVV